MEKTISIGHKIKQLRDEREWSRRQLSDRAGVSGQYIWLLESGRSSRPSMIVVRKLSDAFGVSPMYFID